VNDSQVATQIEKQIMAEPALRERRRRPRVNLSLPIQVRMHNLTAAMFAEVCNTVDVSADGVRFVATQEAYQHGLLLGITFPYSAASSAHAPERQAVVVRVVPLPDEKFEVALRFGRVAQAANDAERTSSQIPGGCLPLRVAFPLVVAVDHDDRSRSALIFTLERDGYRVLAFRAPGPALEALRERVPAMVIADVESDDMSGYDLCLIVKGDERLEHVPVVLATRNGLPSDYATAHAMGATICMTKPYKRDRLLLVARLLATPTLEDAADSGAAHGGSGSALSLTTNSKCRRR